LGTEGVIKFVYMLGMIKSILFWQPTDFGTNSLLFFFSHWFSWLVIFGLSGWWLWKRRYGRIISFWILLITSVILEIFVKHFSPWWRPFLSTGHTPPGWVSSYSQGSFPSGHAIRAVIILFYAWKIDHRLFWILLPGMILVNLGRILFALHYPVDIIGGVALGLIMIWGWEKLPKNLKF